MKTAPGAIFLAVALAVLPAAAQETERPVDGIMDNSFLVEEAYNQEAGVVQHIWTALYQVNRMRGPDEKTWEFGFTQEWPVGSQTHQFSYTTPYADMESDGESGNGPGDMLLNYRYQAYFSERTLTAFAPRLSLILPTGDEAFGDDTVGTQVNLPFSTAVGDNWFVHANAGTTWLPDARSANDRDLVHFNLGGSVIYAATKDLHFMVEWIGNWNDQGNGREFESVISPGARKAFNFANESQLVVGVATPIGLTNKSPDFGVFLYCSFEHFFQRKN